MTTPDLPPDWPTPTFIPHRLPRRRDADVVARAREWYDEMDRRRSVRRFSPEPVPREAIELAIRTASTAPSGAHHQPWRFVAVADPTIRHRIREAAEAEERESYGGRMPDEWLRELAPLGTDWHKAYLDVAPWIVVLFEETHGFHADGRPRKHYYVRESVGIACGMFLTAIHRMGLVALTHTPSPMGFLNEVLGRPANERPFVVMPVGHPAPDCVVPDLRRKPLDDVAIFLEG
jgi:nitroreductase